ncbi:MAG TPA: hypothetical protein VLY83_04975, partial [Methanoregula sp.]|nr:hypothetical protein [Methanoregula sp.]
VAFLESTVNEFYADASDNAYCYAERDHELLLARIAEGWNNERNFDRAPVLAKYQKILAIAGRPQFGKEDPLLADVQTLIGIRNYLMHYRREWVVIQDSGVTGGAQETQGEKIGKILMGRVAPNPLAPENQPFFPNRCLGHGCAEWGVTSALAFTDEFFSRLGLPAPYEAVKKELLTR